MIDKLIKGYFEYLQTFFNPFGIYFDTMYSNQIEDLGMYSKNAILRQQFDYDKLKASHLPNEILQSLRNGRESTGYNCLLYKYSPLERSELHPNADFIYIRHKGETLDIQQQRKFYEIDRGTELYLMLEYKEYLQKELSSDNPMQHTIHDAIIGEIKPQSNDDVYYDRLGVFCDLPIECVFYTTNTSLYQDFQMLYNAFLLRNPPAFLTIQNGKDKAKWEIICKYESISQAEQLDYETNGNILAIGFSVTISTIFLTSFVKRKKAINEVKIFSEIQNG